MSSRVQELERCMRRKLESRYIEGYQRIYNTL